MIINDDDVLKNSEVTAMIQHLETLDKSDYESSKFIIECIDTLWTMWMNGSYENKISNIKEYYDLVNKEIWETMKTNINVLKKSTINKQQSSNENECPSE